MQLALGCPAVVYNGGLAQGRVFYFDPAYKRPGLPPDVAALVRHMDQNSVTLELVNLSPVAERTILVQAGCYGEHRFTTASYVRGAQDAPEAVQAEAGGPVLAVKLLPGCEIELKLGMDRYVHTPRYGLPWRDGTVAE